MTIYFILYIFIAVGGVLFFAKGTSDKKKKIFLGVSFLLMLFIMGFRTLSVGTDTKLYYDIFLNNSGLTLKNINFKSDSSLIYSIYNLLLSFITKDYRILIFCNSFIICFLTCRFIYKNSNNVIASTLFFIAFYHFFQAMNISRQYIAIMIVANAYEYLKNKNIFKYIIAVIIALLIHNTAIIAFSIIPLAYMKKDKIKIVYLIFWAIACFYWNDILNLFARIFSHYSLYTNSSLIEEVGRNRKIIITFIYFIIQMMYLISRKKLKDNKAKEEMQLLYYLNWITIIIGVCSTNVLLLSRIESYFSILNIMYIPKVFNLMKDKQIFYFGMICIMIIPMYFQLKTGNAGVVPYYNWLIN